MDSKRGSTANTKPQRAIILARISDARDDDGRDPTDKGLNDQVADSRKLAKRLGWKVGPDATHVIAENRDPETGRLITSVSAYKRRKVRLPDGRVELRTIRPGFRRALEMLASGAADGLVAVDLDRTCRDPRDLEDLIDTVEARTPRIPVESVTGSLKLATDADITMARVMVAVANKSSRDTARRVSRARERQANEGRFGGGARRYGHNLDGTVREDESVVIKEAAESLLAGVGLRGIVRELNARGVPAARGGRWAYSTMRGLLLQPRIAGLMAFNGDIIEKAPDFWVPIIDRAEWEAIRSFLMSPERRTTPGPVPKNLLSHLARCGHPSHPDDDRPVLVHGLSGGSQWRVPSYKCVSGAGHLSCASRPVNAIVEFQVVDRLSRPDALDLLVPRLDVDATGLVKEANGLRTRIEGLGDLYESGDMTTTEYRVRKARLNEQLSNIEAQLTASAGTSPLDGIAGRSDAEAIWAGYDIPRRKAIIEALMTVTVLCATRRGRTFDDSRVVITWR